MTINYYRQAQVTQQLGIAEARGHFQKDKALRLWAAKHGGVYVPITEETPPSPYLQHIPTRDIIKPDGTRLTLMNPAYMIRQINEHFSEMYGLEGHITSLDPIRPENSPDEWERQSLLAFEKGIKEVQAFVNIDDKPYLRLMQPLITEEGCLRCHAHQGYKAGDVRGGVAIALPMTSYLDKQHDTLLAHFFGLSCAWLLGLAFIFFTGRRAEKILLAKDETITLLQRERDIFKAGPVMTFTWQNRENWPVEQVSANVLDILGHTQEDFLQGTVQYASLIHPEDLQRVVAEVIDNSKPESTNFVHAPYRLVCKNGDEKWIFDSTTVVRDQGGVISHYAGYLIDISDSIQLEEKIIEVKNNLELVIKNTNVGIWDWQVQTGEVEFNERWAEIIGYSLEELAPISIETWMKYAYADDLPESERRLNEYWQGKTEDYTYPCRMKHRNGELIWVLDTGKVVEWTEDGSPKRMIGTHLDITDQIKSEKQLKIALHNAEAANHAKSVFLSNMSHELRTPLNAILGYTQIFAGDSSLTSRQQSGIGTIHQSGEHLLMLINDILDLSKIEADRMELVPTEFRLTEFLNSVVDIIQVRATQQKLNFSCELAENLPKAIEADELRLRQVLLNLLSNAVKFTKQGGCIFRVRSEDCGTNKARLSIAVEDSGAGVAPENAEKIFEPFQQSGDRLKYSEGSGLGLAISRKLVKLMGGALTVTSPINKNPGTGEGPGSRFSFVIEVPVAGAPAHQEQKKRTVTGYTTATGETRNKKILIVDDNPSNRAVLRDTLTPLGFLTEEAEDGSQVLSACQHFAPDAILMDLRMPKVDGFSATKQVKSHDEYKNIPVIAITASAADLQKLNTRCLEHGFDDYIAKPFATTKLLTMLARHLHVELRYDDTETTAETVAEEITYPPAQDMEHLLSLLEIGDIDGIARSIQQLTEREPETYRVFAARIQTMASEFQLTELEEFLHAPGSHHEK